ncbi:MAG: hypothetical protein ABI680_20210, partial [Chthoniobacteraceae bacterium]
KAQMEAEKAQGDSPPTRKSRRQEVAVRDAEGDARAKAERNAAKAAAIEKENAASGPNRPERRARPEGKVRPRDRDAEGADPPPRPQAEKREKRGEGDGAQTSRRPEAKVKRREADREMPPAAKKVNQDPQKRPKADRSAPSKKGSDGGGGGGKGKGKNEDKDNE